jgi:hypothetical protein
VTRCKRPGFTRGPAVAGRQLSPRPSDASPTARRLPRTGIPGDRPPAVPAVHPRCRARQHHGQGRQRRTECTCRRENVTATGAGAERRALSGLAPPASTMLRIPLRGTRLRRAVDPGDLCQPSGPDGEGQAKGQARRARGDLSA